MFVMRVFLKRVHGQVRARNRQIQRLMGSSQSEGLLNPTISPRPSCLAPSFAHISCVAGRVCVRVLGGQAAEFDSVAE